jgi:hypothetical protein
MMKFNPLVMAAAAFMLVFAGVLLLTSLPPNFT